MFIIVYLVLLGFFLFYAILLIVFLGWLWVNLVGLGLVVFSSEWNCVNRVLPSFTEPHWIPHGAPPCGPPPAQTVGVSNEPSWDFSNIYLFFCVCVCVCVWSSVKSFARAAGGQKRLVSCPIKNKVRLSSGSGPDARTPDKSTSLLGRI